MDPILYTSAQNGSLDVLRQNHSQLNEQLATNKSNLLHVSAQCHDSAEFVDEMLNTQSSQVKRSMLTWKNSEGETALHIASRNGRSNIVRLLIQHAQALDKEELESGVKIGEEMMRATDQNGDTALHVAVRNNHTELVELLLTNDPHFEHPMNNMKETPLFLAIERQYHDIVNSILTTCTSPNYEGPDGRTVLHAAVLSQCRDCIASILGRNLALTTEADESGRIPLHYATYNYDTSPLRVLLKANISTAYMAINKDDNKTALHIAACRGNYKGMEELLNDCPDCWDTVTSKGQNVLHLAVEHDEEIALEFILRQKWAVNLINHKDAEGNTPLHLYAKGASMNSVILRRLLEHPLVDLIAVNKVNFTPLDQFYARTIQVSSREMRYFTRKLQEAGVKRGVRRLTRRDDDTLAYEKTYKDDLKQRTERRLEALRKRAEAHLVAATLIATVTFTAGFTLPGGYDGNQGDNQGMAVLVRKAAFKTFVVTDAIAVISSITAVFLHFSATFYKDVDRLFTRHFSALLLIVIAMVTMVIAFITGLYTVLHASLALPITISVMGCFAILLFCYMLRQDDLRSCYAYLTYRL